MLYPSIDKLTAQVESKYTLVTIAAKRARQIRENSQIQVEKPKSKKFVGQALEELIENQLVLDVSEARK
ncbi:DNA-directed RNA polymerase subunit omega [Brevibacillus composti]|uniref:DNA-directed RNA polymerase subunit omega n=1 Tax=Brevibacillus composti TaxID=2796470 RepID=A0A7T5ENS6_9BACL|nr:DNA-directed RNA polymerase subunit omega [Brevibacillus composti]QQE76000.1 DNA-directed RNA polymerase subunit omega [Brevibacillus composti]QUO43026.1 DNA-directed RNA polymerase subunit omega [Brevibacillus composti]